MFVWIIIFKNMSRTQNKVLISITYLKHARWKETLETQ